jgi:hypothetical protein
MAAAAVTLTCSGATSDQDSSGGGTSGMPNTRGGLPGPCVAAALCHVVLSRAVTCCARFAAGGEVSSTEAV